jgi:hypothetical protein
MASVNQEFESAPMGGCIYRQMVGGFVVMVLAFAIGSTAAITTHHGHTASVDWIALAFGPLFGLAIAIPAYLKERSRVARFRIDENCLVLGKERFPLSGVVEITRDPEILRGARKVFGGGALFRRRGMTDGFRGYCKSKRIGRFYRFLTNTDNAVVLKWPDNIVAVSPADPEFFILMARKASGQQ